MMDVLTKAGVRFLLRPGFLLTFHKTDLDWRSIGSTHSGLSATALHNDIQYHGTCILPPRSIYQSIDWDTPQPSCLSTSDGIQNPAPGCILALQRTLFELCRFGEMGPLSQPGSRRSRYHFDTHTGTQSMAHAQPLILLGQPETRDGRIHMSYVPHMSVHALHAPQTQLLRTGWHGAYSAYQRYRKPRAGKLKMRRR